MAVHSALSWRGGKDSALTLWNLRRGFAQINGPFRTSDEAFDVAGALVEMCRLEHGLPPLSAIGDFVVPPLDGAETRDFQTLHFDFGLPLDPKVEGDVARYTARTWPSHTADAERANPERCVSASSATSSSRQPRGSCATTS